MTKTFAAAPAMIMILMLSAGAYAQEPFDPDKCTTAPAGVEGAYKVTFFSNDFGYLDDPCLGVHDPRDRLSRVTDRLKRIKLAEDYSLSAGGEYRLRYHHEDNHARSRLAGLDNSFLLSRLRVYGDVKATEHFRAYVEMIDARSFGEDLPARTIEVIDPDILNGFAEVGMTAGSGRAFLRGGRQELLFGAQRLISPLNWANTRRTFDGVRAGYSGADISLDAWFVNPRVIDARGNSDRARMVDFSGFYATWTGLAGQILDGYVLNLDRDGPAPANIWTFGGRGRGRVDHLLWEIEAALQRGNVAAGDQRAAMLAAGLGYDLDGLVPIPMTLWLYYDLATGDADPADGTHKTFNQLFPLAHAYFGFMDLVARQNIETVSIRWIARPGPDWRLFLSVYDLNLHKGTDALYNAGGAAIRSDPTGAAGTDIGNEVDVVLHFSPVRWLALEAGYSRFFAGDFIGATNQAGVSGDADFTYLQSIFRF